MWKYKGKIFLFLVVRSLSPEIIPSGTVIIPQNSNYVITCKTKGFGKSANSLISWYRTFGNGTRKSLATSEVSEKEMRRDLSVVDVVR